MQKEHARESWNVARMRECEGTRERMTQCSENKGMREEYEREWRNVTRIRECRRNTSANE